MNGTKWIDRGDGRIMTFVNAAKYLAVDAIKAGKVEGKWQTKDVVSLIDDATGAAIVVDVEVFFHQFKPFAEQQADEGQADDMPTIN